MTTYTRTGALSRDDIAANPRDLLNVLGAMRVDLLNQIVTADQRPKGTPRTRYKWVRNDTTTRPHTWRRCWKRNATARHITMTWEGVDK